MIKEGRGRSSPESGAILHPLEWSGALGSSWVMLSAPYSMAFGVQDLG